MASSRIATFDSLGETLAAAAALAGTRTRRLLLAALALSLTAHLALTLWPVDPPVSPESTPLTATITEMPPPPKPSVAAAKPAAPKPRRTRPGPTAPAPEPVPEQAFAEAPVQTAALPAPAPVAAPVAEAPPVEREEIIPGDVVAGKTLPPRVDLAYKVFYGTQGFMIGEAVYRFEHAGNRYRIATLGEARGLAALVLRGQGKIESRGIITDEGLQPQSFRVERGGPDRVETAVFDWEAGIVSLHQEKTAALDLPTFDPLSLMWQYYFTPPTDDRASFTVATPRRVYRYTMTREATDTIELPHGPVEAERWHRRSEDGRTDAYVWLAPSLRHIAVKMRVSHTVRGTIEVLLDAIRVDETATAIGNGLPEFAILSESTGTPPRDAGPTQTYQPSATFPEMTGQ